MQFHWILVLLMLFLPACGAALVWRNGRARRMEIAELASRLAGRLESSATKVGPSLYAHLGHGALVPVADVDFIHVLVIEQDTVAFGTTCKKVLDIALDGGAVLVAHMGALIQLAVDTNAASEARAERRYKIATELAAGLGDRVRLVHGRCDCLVGTVGNEQRKSWIIAPVSTASILGALIEAQPGDMVLWESKDGA